MSGETKQRISELEAEIARLREAQPTLRDQFAMAALTGLLSDTDRDFTYGTAAIRAYEIADIMLEVRDEED